MREMTRQREQPRERERGARQPACCNELGWPTEVLLPACITWLRWWDRKTVGLDSSLKAVSSHSVLSDHSPAVRLPGGTLAQHASALPSGPSPCCQSADLFSPSHLCPRTHASGDKPLIWKKLDAQIICLTEGCIRLYSPGWLFGGQNEKEKHLRHC